MSSHFTDDNRDEYRPENPLMDDHAARFIERKGWL